MIMPAQVPTILLTDIFGINEHLLSFIDDSGLAGHVDIVEPYNGQQFAFETQQQAYDAFIAHGGLDRYTETLRQTLFNKQCPHQLLGFSAGGSAVWRVLDESADVIKNVSSAMCFYPGQIRHFITLQPKVDVTLVFPAFESHFDVKPVIKQLKEKSKVLCIETDYEHGFMNAQLPAFEAQGYKGFVTSLKHKKGRIE
jgi:dienelactone hydrolase